MTVTCRKGALALTMLGLFALLIAGCTSSSSSPVNDKDPASKGAKSPDGPDGYAADKKNDQTAPKKNLSTGKIDDHSGWWCDEHGLPEEVCDLCSRKFREAEKKKGNWCEHDRVKSSCFKCNPGLQEKYAKEYVKRFGKEPPKPDPEEDETPKKDDPKKSKVEQPKKADPPTKTVKVDHGGWWCDEHGVPEEICGRCSAKVAAEFKKKNDWCKEHDRPESQCFICHPELKAKFAKQFETKYGQKPPELEVDEKELPKKGKS